MANIQAPEIAVVPDGTCTPAANIESGIPADPQSPPHKKAKFISLNSEGDPADGTVTPSPIVGHLPAEVMGRTRQAAPALQVELIAGSAGKAPTRGSEFAAGYDLYSAEDKVIPARGRTVVKTGIKIAVPAGTYGRVAPRSGLAVKHGIDTGAGVIDADYRGEVGVVLFNLSDVDFEVKTHDRVAQLVLEQIVMPEVAVVQALDETVRGAGGYGSTGGFGPSK